MPPKKTTTTSRTATKKVTSSSTAKPSTKTTKSSTGAAAGAKEHPPFLDMIQEAVKATGDARSGASRPAIKKWILQTYKLNEGGLFDSHVSAGLKKGVNTGKLEQPNGPSGKIKIVKTGSTTATHANKENKAPAAKKTVAGLKKAAATKTTPAKRGRPKKETTANKTTSKSVKKEDEKPKVATKKTTTAKKTSTVNKKETADKKPTTAAAKKTAAKKEVKKATDKTKKKVASAAQAKKTAAPKKATAAKKTTGHLEGTTDKDLRAETQLELPFWLASVLYNKDMIDMSLPRCYNSRIRNALNASSLNVDLRNLGGAGMCFFSGGNKLMSIVEDEQLVTLLHSTFKQRMFEIQDQSQHSSADSGGEGSAYEFCQKLDSWEKQLFNVGEQSAKDFKAWQQIKHKQQTR
ncbi:DNA replication protein [Microbotryomycetes sp. JL221]|nr:DNA replication protein [Microbotryomycetes sp. JL221]